MHDELTLALRPHRDPRIQTTVVALYDTIAAVPAGSVQVSMRVLGGLSLVARADQRLAIGEKPRGYVGVALNF